MASIADYIFLLSVFLISTLFFGIVPDFFNKGVLFKVSHYSAELIVVVVVVVFFISLYL